MSTFGCPKCFQGDAAAVWNARNLTHLAQLVDESHFSIHILACKNCGQRCVKTFTEFIDWSGGDDAQYWYLIPLSKDEADTLAWQGENANIKFIEHASTARPILQVDYPTGKEKRIFWNKGPVWIVRNQL